MPCWSKNCEMEHAHHLAEDFLTKPKAQQGAPWFGRVEIWSWNKHNILMYRWWGKPNGWGAFSKCTTWIIYYLVLNPFYWEGWHLGALPYIWNMVDIGFLWMPIVGPFVCKPFSNIEFIIRKKLFGKSSSTPLFKNVPL